MRKKLPTRLESDMYDALKAIDEVSYRIASCNDEKCLVCKENNDIKVLIKNAVRQFEETRRYKRL